jgi:hypothetical protein
MISPEAIFYPDFKPMETRPIDNDLRQAFDIEKNIPGSLKPLFIQAEDALRQIRAMQNTRSSRYEHGMPDKEICQMIDQAHCAILDSTIPDDADMTDIFRWIILRNTFPIMADVKSYFGDKNNQLLTDRRANARNAINSIAIELMPNLLIYEEEMHIYHNVSREHNAIKGLMNEITCMTAINSLDIQDTIAIPATYSQDFLHKTDVVVWHFDHMGNAIQTPVQVKSSQDGHEKGFVEGRSIENDTPENGLLFYSNDFANYLPAHRISYPYMKLLTQPNLPIRAKIAIKERLSEFKYTLNDCLDFYK